MIMDIYIYMCVCIYMGWEICEIYGNLRCLHFGCMIMVEIMVIDWSPVDDIWDGDLFRFIVGWNQEKGNGKRISQGQEETNKV